MQPLILSKLLKKDMIDYVMSKYRFEDLGKIDLAMQLQDILQKDATIFQDPVLQLVLRRKSEELTPELSDIDLKSKFKPYAHQILAWKNIRQGNTTVISTGTGSGKTECFTKIMVAELKKIKAKEQALNHTMYGTKALLIYPMNALVIDQFDRLIKECEGTNITVGIYTGSSKTMDHKQRSKYENHPNARLVDTKQASTYPDILLTNYRMLDYMLLRESDQRLLNNMELKYLVVDEAHTYTGTVGLDMACLISKLKLYLKDNGKNIVHIATSATLMQSSPSTSSELDNPIGSAERNSEDEMRVFFSQLFGVDINKEVTWLIQDQFEELPVADSTVWNAFRNIDTEALTKALQEPMPKTLWAISNILFPELPLPELNILIEDSTEGEQDKKVEAISKALFFECKKYSSQLARVVLCEDDTSSNAKSAVRWSIANKVFEEKTQLPRCVLEALLIVCSYASEQGPIPLLGMRLHLFSKTEPRIYWSLDGKKLYTEEDVQFEKNRSSAALVNCRKCGNTAWAGVWKRVGDEGYLTKLPLFYEEDLSSQNFAEEIVVLHKAENIGLEALPAERLSKKELKEKFKILSRKDWDYDFFVIDLNNPNPKIRPVDLEKENKLPRDKDVFIRITRKSQSQGKYVPDTASCPNCGSVSLTDRQTLLTSRSSAAQDLSVYTASILSHLERPSERKLLMFADNRQETSHLAGFITDRHRRFQLRRAISSFMEEAKKKGITSWPLCISEEEKSQKKFESTYLFAARVLLSYAENRFVGDEELHKNVSVSRRALMQIIPRGVLKPNYKIKNQDEIESYKTWLLGNQTIDAARENHTYDQEDHCQILSSDKGKWVLSLLNSLILAELSNKDSIQQTLRSLGIVSLQFQNFDPQDLLEWNRNSQNPEWRLPDEAVLLLAHYALKKLQNRHAWYDLNEEVVEYSDKFAKPGEYDIAKVFNLDNEKASKNHSIAKILSIFEVSDEKKYAWMTSAVWKNFFDKSPMEKLVAVSGNEAKLKTKRVYISSDFKRYRLDKKLQFTTPLIRIDLENKIGPDGKSEWKVFEQKSQKYYTDLYVKTFEQSPKFVSAKEHNGMISANSATEAVVDFTNNHINTLIATPTLEMGVDLPDLPSVIHRSVPPDPSNYTQRAGRAGRGPRRALLLTHCGYRSHDQNFYADPQSMVMGEILPPGIPNENTSILRRHINSIVISYLVDEIQEPGLPHLDLTRWDYLIDVQSMLAKIDKVAGVAIQALEADEDTLERRVNKIDWRAILSKRRNKIQSFLEKYCDDTVKSLKISSASSVRSVLQGYCNLDQWAESFEAAIKSYEQDIQTAIDTFLEIAKVNGAISIHMNETEKNARQLKRAYYHIEYLVKPSGSNNAGKDNHPISYFMRIGFLPNFDFPGKIVRFAGFIPERGNTRNHQMQKSSKDRYLVFDRPSHIALREFAPEQLVYGQGFIYKVDQFEVDKDQYNAEIKKWGICSKGCTGLTEVSRGACDYCGSSLCTDNKTSDGEIPTLIAVRSAFGEQEEIISDTDSRRKFHAIGKEIRHTGIPEKACDSYVSKDSSATQVSLFTQQDNLIETATILCSIKKSSSSPGSDSNSDVFLPVYKEIRGVNELRFNVFANIPSKPDKKSKGKSQYVPMKLEPFYPVSWAKGQALVLTISAQTIAKDNEDFDPRVFYTTLSNLLHRSSTYVLRINKRKGSLLFLNDQEYRDSTSNSGVKQKAIMILDIEEGGSGVIPLIWQYWDQILDKAKEKVLSDCCITGCYQCIRSYENQRDHDYLDKSIFKTVKRLADGKEVYEANFFEGLKKSKMSRVNEPVEVDEKSVAEPFLKEYLESFRSIFRLTTQVVHNRINGKMITSTDFELSHVDGTRISIFLDGRKHHLDKVDEDFERRTKLAQQGYRVISLPANCVIPAMKKEILDAIFMKLKDVYESNKINFSYADIFGVEGVSGIVGKNEISPVDIETRILDVNEHRFSWDEINLQKNKEILKEHFEVPELHELIDLASDDLFPKRVHLKKMEWEVDFNKVKQNKNKEWEALLYISSMYAALGFHSHFKAR